MAKAGLRVTSCEELAAQPEEYRTALRKIVVSHAINEIHGARVFDEPAIALAPTPYAKWLTCRIAMEEYGHHVRFFDLGREMGIPAEDMLPESAGRRTLNIFDFELASWAEFCALKLLGDLAEVLQVEDLLQCSFQPLRSLARMTMPEERFHAQFGKDFSAELCQNEDGRRQMQEAIDRVYPVMPAFFGSGRSRNNEIFRKWAIKQRTNDEMRQDYVARARAAVEDELGLRLPAESAPS